MVESQEDLAAELAELIQELTYAPEPPEPVTWPQAVEHVERLPWSSEEGLQTTTGRPIWESTTDPRVNYTARHSKPPQRRLWALIAAAAVALATAIAIVSYFITQLAGAVQVHHVQPRRPAVHHHQVHNAPHHHTNTPRHNPGPIIGNIGHTL